MAGRRSPGRSSQGLVLLDRASQVVAAKREGEMSDFKYRRPGEGAQPQQVQLRGKVGAATQTAVVAEQLGRQVQMRRSSDVWNPPVQMHARIGDGWNSPRTDDRSFPGSHDPSLDGPGDVQLKESTGRLSNET